MSYFRFFHIYWTEDGWEDESEVLGYIRVDQYDSININELVQRRRYENVPYKRDRVWRNKVEEWLCRRQVNKVNLFQS